MVLGAARGATPIEQFEGLSSYDIERLRALSITTAEQLAAATRAAPDAMSRVVPGLEMRPRMEMAMFSIARDLAPGLMDTPVVFGATAPLGAELPEQIPEDWLDDYLARGPLPRAIPTPALAPEPPMPGDPPAGGPPGPVDLDPPLVNLAPHMRPVRDQGRRSTCTAHAVGALMEFYSPESFGPQYIYWQAKSTDGDPNQPGTWIANCMEQVASQGSAREQTWPYNPAVMPGNESQGPAPDPARAEAPRFKLPAVREVAPRGDPRGISSEAVMAELANNTPVAISVVSPRSLWQENPLVVATGIFTMPLPGTQAGEAHSVCAVGYGRDPDMTGGGYIIFRNSWGLGYYPQSPFGAGYGALPLAYIDEWGLEAYSVTH